MLGKVFTHNIMNLNNKIIWSIILPMRLLAIFSIQVSYKTELYNYLSLQVYLDPGPLMERAPSDRAESEFTVRNETHRSPALEEEERRAASRAASEIYASTRFPRPQSEMR